MSRSPHVLTLAIGILLVAAFTGNARASKTVPGNRQPITSLAPVVEIGPRIGGDPECSAGFILQPVDKYEYIEPDQGPDMYFVRLDPATCTSCSPGSQLRATQVQLVLWFPGSCTQPIDIAFYGTKTRLGCTEAPDETKILAGPFHFELPGAPSLDATTAQPILLNLPQPVVLPHVAFVGMTFTSFGQSPTSCAISLDGGITVTTTEIVYGDTTQCAPCKAFNYYQDPGGMYRTDYCVSNSKTGPPILFVNGTCGAYVPTLPATWGQLKIRYNKPRRRSCRRIVRSQRTRSCGASAGAGKAGPTLA